MNTGQGITHRIQSRAEFEKLLHKNGGLLVLLPANAAQRSPNQSVPSKAAVVNAVTRMLDGICLKEQISSIEQLITTCIGKEVTRDSPEDLTEPVRKRPRPGVPDSDDDEVLLERYLREVGGVSASTKLSEQDKEVLKSAFAGEEVTDLGVSVAVYATEVPNDSAEAEIGAENDEDDDDSDADSVSADSEFDDDVEDEFPIEDIEFMPLQVVNYQAMEDETKARRQILEDQTGRLLDGLTASASDQNQQLNARGNMWIDGWKEVNNTFHTFMATSGNTLLSLEFAKFMFNGGPALSSTWADIRAGFTQLLYQYNNLMSRGAQLAAEGISVLPVTPTSQDRRDIWRDALPLSVWNKYATRSPMELYTLLYATYGYAGSQSGGHSFPTWIKFQQRLVMLDAMPDRQAGASEVLRMIEEQKRLDLLLLWRMIAEQIAQKLYENALYSFAQQSQSENKENPCKVNLDDPTVEWVPLPSRKVVRETTNLQYAIHAKIKASEDFEKEDAHTVLRILKILNDRQNLAFRISDVASEELGELCDTIWISDEQFMDTSFPELAFEAAAQILEGDIEAADTFAQTLDAHRKVMAEIFADGLRIDLMHLRNTNSPVRRAIVTIIENCRRRRFAEDLSSDSGDSDMEDLSHGSSEAIILSQHQLGENDIPMEVAFANPSLVDNEESDEPADVTGAEDGPHDNADHVDEKDNEDGDEDTPLHSGRTRKDPNAIPEEYLDGRTKQKRLRTDVAIMWIRAALVSLMHQASRVGIIRDDQWWTISEISDRIRHNVNHPLKNLETRLYKRFNGLVASDTSLSAMLLERKFVTDRKRSVNKYQLIDPEYGSYAITKPLFISLQSMILKFAEARSRKWAPITKQEIAMFVKGMLEALKAQVDDNNSSTPGLSEALVNMPSMERKLLYTLELLLRSCYYIAPLEETMADDGVRQQVAVSPQWAVAEDALRYGFVHISEQFTQVVAQEYLQYKAYRLGMRMPDIARIVSSEPDTEKGRLYRKLEERVRFVLQDARSRCDDALGARPELLFGTPEVQKSMTAFIEVFTGYDQHIELLLKLTDGIFRNISSNR